MHSEHPTIPCGFVNIQGAPGLQAAAAGQQLHTALALGVLDCSNTGIDMRLVDRICRCQLETVCLSLLG